MRLEVNDMAMVVDQPFQILLELVQEHKLDPWDIDIEKLAEVFILRLREMKEFDLRISGRTLLSASMLLRVKSEHALNGRGGTLTAGEELGELFDLNLPELGQISIVQRAPRKITLVELIGALQEALTDIPPQKPSRSRRLEKIVQTLSEYHVNIERHLNELYQRIKNSVALGREISFFELIPERTRLSIARTLLLLLFLCIQGKVILRQAESFGEIFVSLPGEAA